MRDSITVTVKAVIAFIAGQWAGLHPLVQTLVVLMILDILTGVGAAYIAKTLSSDATFRGMAKKAMVLCIVAGAHFASGATGLDLQLGPVVAAFYCLNELVSLLENGSAVGIPIPKALTDAIGSKKKAAQ